jgi:hypothetical protein
MNFCPSQIICFFFFSFFFFAQPRIALPFNEWKATQPTKAGAVGKPNYIPGESMVQYNARCAQWLKGQSMEKGTQAAFTSKVKRPDTGTSSKVAVGTPDSGEYESKPEQSATDASLAHGGVAADAGTYENEPTTYDEGGYGNDAGYDHAYAQGGYEEGGYAEGGYDEAYADGGYDEGY